MKTRREMIIMLGAGALAVPLACIAQQKNKIWRIGFLWESEPSIYIEQLDAFKVGMRELSYVEGRDYVIE